LYFAAGYPLPAATSTDGLLRSSQSAYIVEYLLTTRSIGSPKNAASTRTPPTPGLPLPP
jgi:hypothetical protein